MSIFLKRLNGDFSFSVGVVELSNGKRRSTEAQQKFCTKKPQNIKPSQRKEKGPSQIYRLHIFLTNHGALHASLLNRQCLVRQSLIWKRHYKLVSPRGFPRARGVNKAADVTNCVCRIELRDHSKKGRQKVS